MWIKTWLFKLTLKMLDYFICWKNIISIFVFDFTLFRWTRKWFAQIFNNVLLKNNNKKPHTTLSKTFFFCVGSELTSSYVNVGNDAFYWKTTCAKVVFNFWKHREDVTCPWLWWGCVGFLDFEESAQELTCMGGVLVCIILWPLAQRKKQEQAQILSGVFMEFSAWMLEFSRTYK